MVTVIISPGQGKEFFFRGYSPPPGQNPGELAVIPSVRMNIQNPEANSIATAMLIAGKIGKAAAG